MRPSDSRPTSGPAAVFRDDLMSMSAYAVQDSRGLRKLDAMENPFGLPAPLQTALGERLGRVELNRYPALRVAELAERLRSHAGIPEHFGLCLGNGSDELIAMLSMACARPGAVALAPVPGFVMYEMSARLQGLGFVGVPLTPDFALDESALLDAIARHRPALVYLAYPNNPTANLWDDAVMARVVDAAPGLVVIDEAYQPFAGRSYLERAVALDKVLVMRTLSKFGLAGVRIGYLTGPRALVQEIEKVRPPYNVSSLNAECALFALDHADEFDRQARAIVAQRGELLRDLAAVKGIRPYPSDANMILVRILSDDPDRASAVHRHMRERGVLVKNVAGLHPLLTNCLRLTVGTVEDNRAMLAALEASL